MANTKTTGLAELAETPANDDIYPIVDVSDTTMALSGTNKYIKASRIVHQNESNQVTLLGNMAIGTAVSTPRLLVSANTAEILRITSVNTTGNPQLGFAQTTVQRSYIQHNDTSDTFAFVSKYGDISFKAASTAGTNSETEYMRIISGGNVGIGTASPTAKLDVAGTVQCDALRIDQTPTAGTFTETHYINVNLNGTTYRIPCAI